MDHFLLDARRLHYTALQLINYCMYRRQQGSLFLLSVFFFSKRKCKLHLWREIFRWNMRKGQAGVGWSFSTHLFNIAASEVTFLICFTRSLRCGKAISETSLRCDKESKARARDARLRCALLAPIDSCRMIRCSAGSPIHFLFAFGRLWTHETRSALESTLMWRFQTAWNHWLHLLQWLKPQIQQKRNRNNACRRL